MNIESEINLLESEIENGEKPTHAYLAQLETMLQQADCKNKDVLLNKLFLIREQLYPTKAPTKWEILLAELSLKENIEPVFQLALHLDKCKKLKLRLEEINGLEREYDNALTCLNNPDLFSEKEKIKIMKEFQKKIKVFHNRLATELDENFCSYLKQKRLEKGLSLKDLEDLTGISSSHIHRIENNNRKPSIRAVEKLSKALEIPNEYFFENMKLDIGKRDLLEIVTENQFLVNGRKLTDDEVRQLKTYIKGFI